MIFEFAAPTTVIVNSMRSKLAPMIHYQLPQWTELESNLIIQKHRNVALGSHH
jgi:hypothetical protein